MWETNINWYLSYAYQPGTKPATQRGALTRNQTGDVSLCGMVHNQLSHTGQGSTQNIFPTCTLETSICSMVFDIAFLFFCGTNSSHTHTRTHNRKYWITEYYVPILILNIYFSLPLYWIPTIKYKLVAFSSTN